MCFCSSSCPFFLSLICFCDRSFSLFLSRGYILFFPLSVCVQARLLFLSLFLSSNGRFRNGFFEVDDGAQSRKEEEDERRTTTSFPSSHRRECALSLSHTHTQASFLFLFFFVFFFFCIDACMHTCICLIVFLGGTT